MTSCSRNFKKCYRMKKKILIVEDEEEIGNLISKRLDDNVFDVDIALDGKEAMFKLSQGHYDLVTLDIMLPFVDGFEICAGLREKSKQTLIVIISALETQDFKEKGYACGCDDYIAKPFSPKELALKIKTLLKRREELIASHAQQLSNIILNEESKEIIISGFTLVLTPSEYLILSILITHHKRVHTRGELAQLIYDNYLGEIDERGIDSHIYHIRKKIKQYEAKEIIKTVRGMGYKIDGN